MVSRRAALAGGAVAFGALGVGAGSWYRPGIDPREPPADAWPMAGYGPSGTAANADASLPASPESAWSTKPLNGIYPTGLVADAERVYAAGDGVAALDRGDGATAWTDDGDVGGPAALAGGSLYVAPGDSVRGVRQAVVAFDGRSGDRRWTASSVVEATSVLVADGSLFVGTESGLSGLDDSNGGERWSVAGPYEPVPVVAGGRLCATEGSPSFGGETVAFRSRTATDVAVGRSPSVGWTQDHGGGPLGVSATDGRLVVGVSRSAETAGPILMCHDIESGGVEWQATVPAADRDEPARGGPLAVSDGRCVAGYSRGDAVSGTDAVVCRAVGDGEPLWRIGTDGHVTDIAVVGDGVVFGTENGIVRAVDLETGADRWRVEIVVRVHVLAPVDGTVFVASRGGQVFAVR
jgi:outer membrane protein assembly factor BamB